MPATLTPAPALPQTRANLSAVGLLRGWHLFSLDAPTVAVVWTAFFARVSHSAVPAGELLALFLAVWLLYVADRLLDARSATPDAFELQPRHTFHQLHRRALLIASALAASALLPLTLHLPTPDLHLDLALAAALALWFLLIHRLAPARTLPKELTTGLFFAAATLAPTLIRRPSTALVADALLFAALCTVNGLAITAWEAYPLSTTRAHRQLSGALIALALAAFSLAVLTHNLSLLAVALAAAGLLLLHTARARLHPTTLRALADLSLLTPILLWPFLS